MSDLPAQIELVVRERKLFRRGERILVAVSGGRDSMVLLRILHVLSEAHGWKLFVAHFNHQLRGRASEADERFIAQAARTLGLSFASGRGEVRSVARTRGESLEMAARDLRHRFLARTARKVGCRCVALAHHADDQVELFFIRLLRGAGTEGLGGMRWVSPSPADRQIRLVRPLLAVGRDELRKFARRERIPFREDASNDSREFLRNRIRHELLPLLERDYQPAIRKIVERTMELVAGDAEVVIEAARTALRMKPRTIRGWPVGLQRRLVQWQLQRRGVAVDYELTESLRTQPNRLFSISPQLAVACDRMGRLRFVRHQVSEFDDRRATVALAKRTGTVSFSSVKLSWRFETRSGLGLQPTGPGLECFDADRVGPRFLLRHWQPGDRFQPIGMKSTVKMQDWFTNRKIPRAERRRLLVAETSKGEVFWVEGQRIAEVAKLRPATKRRLIWRWQRG